MTQRSVSDIIDDLMFFNSQPDIESARTGKPMDFYDLQEFNLNLINELCEVLGFEGPFEDDEEWNGEEED
jgi:hypothetical protein